MTIADLTLIKITLVDTATPSLLETATGGLVTYPDLYAHNGDDVAATIKAAAGILAGYYASQPVSVGSGGESVAWAAERFAFYDRLSRGSGGGIGATTTSGAGGESTLTPTW